MNLWTNIILGEISAGQAEQKEEARRKQELKNKPKKPGFDGRWYTDINTQSTW